MTDHPQADLCLAGAQHVIMFSFPLAAQTSLGFCLSGLEVCGLYIS